MSGVVGRCVSKRIKEKEEYHQQLSFVTKLAAKVRKSQAGSGHTTMEERSACSRRLRRIRLYRAYPDIRDPNLLQVRNDFLKPLPVVLWTDDKPDVRILSLWYELGDTYLWRVPFKALRSDLISMGKSCRIGCS